MELGTGQEIIGVGMGIYWARDKGRENMAEDSWLDGRIDSRAWMLSKGRLVVGYPTCLGNQGAEARWPRLRLDATSTSLWAPIVFHGSGCTRTASQYP